MNREILIRELSLKALRSSGPGGQHVNKVSSKIELRFDLNASEALSEEEKELLLKTLKKKLSREGHLIMQCDESRNQHRNKEIVINRFLEVIKKGLRKPKKRKKTSIPKKAIEKRLDDKKRRASKKEGRRKPGLD